MNPMRFSLVVTSALVLVGCATPGEGWMNSPLKDTAWKLVTTQASDGNSGRQFVGNNTDIVMRLLANGDAEFVLGCEKGSSDWFANPGINDTQGEIEFYPVELAASSCEPDLAVNRFLSDVTFLEGYVLIQNHLYLNTAANQKIYGWRQVPLN